MTLFNYCVFVYNQWCLFKVPIILDFEPRRRTYWFYNVCVCVSLTLNHVLKRNVFLKMYTTNIKYWNRGLIIYKPLKVKFI